MKDGTETDVDCGGTCPACADGQRCKISGDCQSGSSCVGGLCGCDGTVTSVLPTPSATALMSSAVGPSDAPGLSYLTTNSVEELSCTANCGTASPTFANGTPFGGGTSVTNTGADSAWPDGGNQVTAIVGTISGLRELLYGECPGPDCTQAANWTLGAIASPSQLATPAIAAVGNVRGVAYWGTQGVTYAECSASCNRSANWSGGTATTQNPDTGIHPIALALHYKPGPFGTLTLVHHLFVRSEYDECSGANCTTTANWTRVNCPGGNCPNFKSDIHMAVDAAGLPHVAGADGCSHIYAGRCTATPCTTSSNWTNLGIQIATDKQCNSDQISFQLDALGLGHVVYLSQSGLAQLDEQPNGTWSEKPLTTCEGASIKNVVAPSLLLTPQGSTRVFMQLSSPLSLPDGGSIPVGAAWYSSGP